MRIFQSIEIDLDRQPLFQFQHESQHLQRIQTDFTNDISGVREPGGQSVNALHFLKALFDDSDRNHCSPTIQAFLPYGQTNTHIWAHLIILLGKFMAVVGLHPLYVFPHSGDAGTIDV